MYKVNIEEIAEKVGGPFHLTVLIQKRLKEMKKHEKDREKKFGKNEKVNLIDLVCQEILEGKVYLEEDKTEYEEDVDISSLYQTPLDDDDLAIGSGKGNSDAGFTINTDD